MKMTSQANNLKDEDDLKKEGDLRIEDDLKNGHYLKNTDYLKEGCQSQFPAIFMREWLELFCCFLPWAARPIRGDYVPHENGEKLEPEPMEERLELFS